MQVIEIQEPGEEKTTSQEVVVGIDFGTTNSLIAVSKDYQVEFFKINGKDICPSIITITEDNNHSSKVEIGGVRSSGSIYSIKRYLAKSCQEIADDPCLSRQQHFFDLTGNIPRIRIGDRFCSVTEAASYIFKFLKNSAEQQLNLAVKKAVISVPAYFDDNARGQVMLAAKLADLEVIRLIAEPTAAAYAYGLNNTKSHKCNKAQGETPIYNRPATSNDVRFKNETCYKQQEGAYLVYDFGGGTFDVSVLNMTTGVLQVMATSGDNLLGGDDIDWELAKYLAKKYYLIKEPLSEAKILKEQLSKTDQAQVQCENIHVMVTKSEFEEIIRPIITKTIKIAQDAIDEAGNIELDGIILVGGSTRIPLIKQLLKHHFKVPIFADLDPDKIVVMGAAMQAENLTSKSNSLLIDVVPLSLGMELYGSMVEKIILRNTPIPFSVSKEFTTHVDNQTGMQFHIVQGEREMVNDCRSLAKFELCDIIPQKAGKARIEVTFSIDADGILSVTAYDKNTGKLQAITIKPSYGITEEDVIATLRSAYENAEYDHNLRLLMETKLQAESLINGIEVAIKETPDILNEVEMQSLNDSIESLKNMLIENDNKKLDRQKLITSINQLNNEAAQFIQKHLDKGVDVHLKGRHVNEIKF